MGAIVTMIWGVIGPTVISLALNVGLPKAMAWLLSKGLPSWLLDGLLKIIKDALGQISTIKNDQTLTPAMQREGIRSVKKMAKSSIKAHINAKKREGVGLPPDLK